MRPSSKACFFNVTRGASLCNAAAAAVAIRPELDRTTLQRAAVVAVELSPKVYETPWGAPRRPPRSGSSQENRFSTSLMQASRMSDIVSYWFGCNGPAASADVPARAERNWALSVRSLRDIVNPSIMNCNASTSSTSSTSRVDHFSRNRDTKLQTQGREGQEQLHFIFILTALS